MNAEVREALGKAAHEAMARYFDDMKSPFLIKSDYVWEFLDEPTRELYRCEAEGVVYHLAALIGIPVLQMLLTEDDVKRLLEQL